MVATCQLLDVWTDTHGRSVVSGNRYAIGRGSRVKSVDKMTVYRDDETGDWYAKPRQGNQVVRLGIPNQQDASGEQALIAFVPLGDDWEELAKDCDLALDRRLLFDAVVDRAANARSVLADCYAQLLELASDQLTEDERDQLRGKVYDDALSDDLIFNLISRVTV